MQDVKSKNIFAKMQDLPERLRRGMDGYDPVYPGCRWDDENPRIQLEPRGARGDIELRAVRRARE